MNRNNKNLKTLNRALCLSHRQVARATTLGGIATTTSCATSWFRSETSIKSSERRPGRGMEGRFRPMDDAQFDAFCVGLKPLIDEIDSGGKGGGDGNER